MLKRLCDLLAAVLFLLPAAPIMLLVAVLIRLDSPGPILYGAPKVGRRGKRFGMLRFRTVDLGKPAYLPMEERMTRVGRMIRKRSLDDLPNLLNLLWGDLSLVGPRPTEPERVDLADPVWQQILAVRPGLISPAILALGRRYNGSPHALKQQLELEYVQTHSLQLDLHLFRQAIQGFWASRGNWKARGAPAVAVSYTGYQPATAAPPSDGQHRPSGLTIDGRNDPDLVYAARFVQEHSATWEPYVPQFCLVPCDSAGQKPALFLRIEHGFEQWSRHVELAAVRWPVVSTNRYVCLGAVLCFQDTTGVPIQGSAGTPAQQGSSRFVCSTILDVASPAVEAWFSAGRRLPGEIPLFFVNADRSEIAHRFFSIHSPESSDSPANARAFQQWEDAKARLQRSGFALDNFAHDSQLLRRTLPHRTRWETVDALLGSG